MAEHDPHITRVVATSAGEPKWYGPAARNEQSYSSQQMSQEEREWRGVLRCSIFRLGARRDSIPPQVYRTGTAQLQYPERGKVRRNGMGNSAPQFLTRQGE